MPRVSEDDGGGGDGGGGGGGGGGGIRKWLAHTQHSSTVAHLLKSLHLLSVRFVELLHTLLRLDLQVLFGADHNGWVGVGVGVGGHSWAAGPLNVLCSR